MNYNIVKADIDGCIIRLPNDPETYYCGSWSGQGNCYKDKAAFDSGNGVCYINEYAFLDEVGWDEVVPDELQPILDKIGGYCGVGVYNEDYQCGYTRHDIEVAVRDWVLSDSDLLDNADINQQLVEQFITHMAAWAFEICDWQAIETYLYELDIDEQWDNFCEAQKTKGE